MRKYVSLVFCLLFLLSASSAGAIASARPAAGPSARTYAENWKETFVQRQGKVATALDGGKTVQVYTSLPHAAKVRFTAMAPHWKASVPAGASLQVFVRKSVDGKTWGRWLLAEPNHDDPDRDVAGRSFGMLVTGDPAGYGQYKVVSSPSPRGEQPRVSDVTLTFIDASQGPTTAQARASASASAGLEASAVSRPAVVSRAGWGADESLRFDADGQEIWPKEYLQVTKAVLHDTITANNDPNPARTMRSIYYYHAVTRGWGDIGYNYLIDEQGAIYEGRVGGENSVAGHVRCYNFGTVGIAALGDHAKVQPSEAMMTSFKKIIAWHFDRAGINPHGRGIFMKNNIEPLAVQNNIMAHVDTSRSSFTCGNTHVDPGPYIYNRLGEIRDSVATIMGYTPTPKPVITDVTFAPTRLNQGRTLRVEVRLINTGTGLMETQAPYPGFVYQAGQDWSDLAFDKVDGKYRVVVDSTANPTGNAGPYRWGLGSALLPGQSNVIVGYIQLPQTGTSTYWGGLNKENAAAVVARTGDAQVSVVRAGAEDATGGVIQGVRAEPGAISPNGDGVADGTTISYTLTSAQQAKVMLYTASGQFVRTLSQWESKAAGTHTAALDGRYFDPVRRAAYNLSAGTYRVLVLTRDSAGAVHEAALALPVDFTAPLAGTISRAPATISPNNDKVQDYTTISGTFSESVAWMLRVRNSSGALVREIRGAGPNVSVQWDGRTRTGTSVSDGQYRYYLSYSDLAGNVGLSRSGGIKLDTTTPIVGPLSASGAGPYTLQYTTNELGNVWLSIHNSKGVEVRSFVKTVRNAGTYTQSWDGKLATGASAPSGTCKWYVFLTDAGGNRAQRFPSSATITEK